MILAIDAGNTRTKAAVFQQDSLVEAVALRNEAVFSALEKIIEKYPVSDIVLASVTHEKGTELRKFGIPVQVIDRNWTFPFENRYATPETLGVDRMVLASGATLAFPGTNRLVIDAGTCVTYDFVDADDRYHGGAISPGLRMRYEALHHYTARLPLLETENPAGLIGDTTAASMHSGVVNGLVAEVERFIDGVSEPGNFTIILTGGDGEFLAKRLKNTIFAHSNFLLESLNRTFQYARHD